MTAGITMYNTISSGVPQLVEDSLAVARMSNVLIPTVTTMGGKGLLTRSVYEWPSATFVAAGEDDDTSAQTFDKTSLSTLTPAMYRARFDITDADVESDYDRVMSAAALELGGASAEHIDKNVATNFSSVTGGTIGSGSSSTISWQYITDAYALLSAQNVPASSPVYCALHPYQWVVLLRANTIAASTVVAVAPGFQDATVRAPSFFRVPMFQGITFVITNNITIASTAAYGCMYTPEAFAVDTRKPFNIRPQRNESRELTELNTSMWYAHGTWRPDFAISLYTNAGTPTGS